MTERKRRKRLQDALMLLAHVAEGCSEAMAWRKVKPSSKAGDKSAAEMFRREMRWMEEHPDAPALASDWWQEPKRCIGVGDRPCGKEIPRRQKRCNACATEQHRELANAKRNERRRRQQQRERAAAAAAAEQKEREHRAKLPRVVEHNGKKYLYYPETGEWKIWGYRDFYDQVREFVPVRPGYPIPPVPPGVPEPNDDRRQRQHEASQPGRAPKADRRSGKQNNLPASSGKKRKAEANGASPKRRCKACTHPDRAAIDEELLQAVSLPTVGGRYGISSSTLDRHRSRHVKAPTVGDILEPVDRDESWREWNGTEWRRIAPPRRAHLREVKGRPHDIPQRSGWSVDLGCGVIRKVYRRLGSR